jgi:hypothetical protein
MRARAIKYLLWSLVLAESLCGTSALVIWLLGLPWQGLLGDLLFIEGGLLLITGGLADVLQSVTVAHIRSLAKRHPSDPPPQVRGPGRRYILLLAGMLLCMQGILLVYRIRSSPP